MQERTQERVEETGFMKFLGLQEFDTEMAEGGVATGAAQRRRAVNSTPTMSDELVAVKRQQLVNALATHRAMKETRKLLGMAVHSGRLAKGDKVGKVVLTAVDGYQSATRDSPQNHGLWVDAHPVCSAVCVVDNSARIGQHSDLQGGPDGVAGVRSRSGSLDQAVTISRSPHALVCERELRRQHDHHRADVRSGLAIGFLEEPGAGGNFGFERRPPLRTSSPLEGREGVQASIANLETELGVKQGSGGKGKPPRGKDNWRRGQLRRGKLTRGMRLSPAQQEFCEGFSSHLQRQ